jgi:RNA polymerase sigma factor (sigma-70 family)
MRHKGQEKDEDRRLLKKAAQGDASAWASLVEIHSPLVMAVTRSYHLPEEDRADAYQNSFVELFKHLSSLEDVESLPAWLRTVTSRQSLKMKERRQKLPPSGGEETLAALPSADALESELLQAERDHEVRRALSGLSETCQKLIRALFYDDPPKAYQEAAKEAGLSIGSIGATRQRCLASLEKILRARGAV